MAGCRPFRLDWASLKAGFVAPRSTSKEGRFSRRYRRRMIRQAGANDRLFRLPRRAIFSRQKFGGVPCQPRQTTGRCRPRAGKSDRLWLSVSNRSTKPLRAAVRMVGRPEGPRDGFRHALGITSSAILNIMADPNRRLIDDEPSRQPPRLSARGGCAWTNQDGVILSPSSFDERGPAFPESATVQAGRLAHPQWIEIGGGPVAIMASAKNPTALTD